MTLLFAESEKEAERVIFEFYSVCTRRKLQVNAEKSKERREAKVFDFNTPYRVSVSVVGRCEVVLGGEKMEKVKRFKYL